MLRLIYDTQYACRDGVDSGASVIVRHNFQLMSQMVFSQQHLGRPGAPQPGINSTLEFCFTTCYPSTSTSTSTSLLIPTAGCWKLLDSSPVRCDRRCGSSPLRGTTRTSFLRERSGAALGEMEDWLLLKWLLELSQTSGLHGALG